MSEKSVAIVLYYPGSLKFHPTIVNTSQLLAAAGFSVNIYKPFHYNEGTLSSPEIKIIHGCIYSGNPFLRVFSLVKLTISMLQPRNGHSAIIGVDSYGLLLATIANLFHRSRVIYLSLELLSTKMSACIVTKKPAILRCTYYLHNLMLKWIEKRLHVHTNLTIIQDEIRWNVLKKLNNLNNTYPAMFMPNSPMAHKLSSRNSNYLREKYEIPKNRIIVIYSGSLGVWTGIDRIISATERWDDRFVLILHGRGIPEFMNDLCEYVSHSDGKIILSTDQLEESEYEEMINSADIGLSWYADQSDPNVYYIGAGSGKLFYYLKHGLPVITNRYPGLPEIVEDNNAGLCLENENKISNGLNKIVLNYQSYSSNAKKAFELYEFSKNFSPFLEYLSRNTA